MLEDHVPMKHALHVDTPAPDTVPAGQSMHVDELVAPICVDAVPAPHTSQLRARASEDHDPGPQAWQLPSWSTNAPGPHGMHASELVAPATVEYVPAGQ